MSKIIKEFKQFAIKGNMIDMAVGIIIGGAFGKIVSSLVSDIIMPPLGVLIGGVNFTNLSLPLKKAVIDTNGTITQEAVNLNYGAFIQVVFDFFIIALAIFFLIRMINRLRKSEDAPVAEPVEPAPTKEELLLTEIRDLLKDKK